MNPKFQIGDTVKLKSGGPIMTVDELVMTWAVSRTDVSKFTGKVKCVWFADNQNQSETFHQDALEIVVQP